MAESSEYNLFYFELRMQYMWPIAGGYFVNVDFVVLGHPSNKRKRDSYPFGGTNTAINFLLLFVTCLLKVLIQSFHHGVIVDRDHEGDWLQMTSDILVHVFKKKKKTEV